MQSVFKAKVVSEDGKVNGPFTSCFCSQDRMLCWQTKMPASGQMEEKEIENKTNRSERIRKVVSTIRYPNFLGRILVDSIILGTEEV